MDLGASPIQAVRRVLLPMLWPAIFASAVLVFADVIDDFVIVRALSAELSSETMSVKIYNGARSTATPALNALATIMLVISIIAVADRVPRVPAHDPGRQPQGWRRARPVRGAALTMDFSLESGQLELRDRAEALTAELMTLEDRCEADRGLDERVTRLGRRAHPPPPSQRHQHARGVGWSGAEHLRPGDRPVGARRAHQRALGPRLAARQRAASLHGGAARALPDSRDRRASAATASR